MMLNNIDSYVEPFVGGANIIDKVQASSRVGYDYDKYVIELLNHIKTGGDIPEVVTKENYIDAKAHYIAKDNHYKCWYIAAIGYLTSGTGRIYNGYRAHTLEKYVAERQILLEQAKYLRDVQFINDEYKSVSANGSLIYCNIQDEVDNGKLHETEFWEKVAEWERDNIVIVRCETAPQDYMCVWEDKDSKQKLYINKVYNIEHEEDYNF